MNIKKKDINILSKHQFQDIVNDYFKKEKELLNTFSKEEQINYMSSHLNFFNYRNDYDNKKLNLNIGDICYIDYGINYIRECGYFHLGIIVEIKNNKCLVLPMTSNPKTFENAVFWKYDNLLALPSTSFLDKNTTLFLNDAKFINPARIISVISNIDKNSNEFKRIRNIFNNYITNND